MPSQEKSRISDFTESNLPLHREAYIVARASYGQMGEFRTDLCTHKLQTVPDNVACRDFLLKNKNPMKKPASVKRLHLFFFSDRYKI